MIKLDWSQRLMVIVASSLIMVLKF